MVVDGLQLVSSQAVDSVVNRGDAVAGGESLDLGLSLCSSISFAEISSESGGSEDASHHNAQQNGDELLEVVHW